MILYRLRCRAQHDFEAWFRDSATFDRQAKAGDVNCPYCGTTKIAKAPMAPRLAAGLRDKDSAAGVAGGDGPAEARASEVAARILRAVEGIRDHVEETCDYVGDEFADEARRITKGEAEERDIYGEATPAEADELDDEGIEVFRLPFRRRRTKS